MVLDMVVEASGPGNALSDMHDHEISSVTFVLYKSGKSLSVRNRLLKWITRHEKLTLLHAH